jgi:hypothetical protein
MTGWQGNSGRWRGDMVLRRQRMIRTVHEGRDFRHRRTTINLRDRAKGMDWRRNWILDNV